MKKNNPDHPIHRRSCGGLGAEARQKKREIGEALRCPLPLVGFRVIAVRKK